MEKKYSIKVISNSCGILPHTLRTWEQRYGVFSPERSEGGQRLYSGKDLERAKLLAKLLGQGHTISKLARYSNEELRALIKDVTGESKEEVEKFNSKLNVQKLINYLNDYKIDAVASELQHLRMSVGAKDFIFNIVLPTMREIGELVAKGNYSVTQEHIISTIVREQLGQIYLPKMGDKRNEMAMATPEGNLHELSLLMADILCKANRVPSRYLGASHPADCLGEALNALKSPILVLGAVTSDQWDYDENIVPYLMDMDKVLKTSIRVILGGGKLLEFPTFKNITEVTVLPTLEDFDNFLEKLS